MRRFIPIHFLFATEPRHGRLLAPLALLAAGLCAVPLLAAQPQAEITKPATARRSAHPHKRAAVLAKSAATPAVEAPPQPVVPKWPVNEKPALASVVWDSHGLRIEARNSSLHQILEDVASATGAKVEGMGSDERIYGAYGPGQVRDVLSQLLQGSGYNILMVGDQGQGAPRQILLSSRHGGEAPAQAKGGGDSSNDQDEDADTDEPQPPAPTPSVRPAFAPGAQPRTPQQIMQEMQQRQQMMQQREQPAPAPPQQPQ